MDITRAIAGYRKFSRLAHGAKIAAMVRLGGGKVGRGLEAESGALIRWGGHSGITIGDHVRLGRGVILDSPRGSTLIIGDRVKIMHYTVIAAAEQLRIGEDTQIAEHCSIRDSDHGTDANRLIREQNKSSPTQIGSDVWIARGSAVLRGSDVGDGVVVGANSVVKGDVEPGAIVVGAPAQRKSSRY